MFDDTDVHQGVAGQEITVTACLRIGLAVERDTSVTAYSERRINLYNIQYMQIQTVIDIITIFFHDRFVISATLIRHNRIPCKRNLVRTNRKFGRYCIHFADRQLQYIDTVATETVSPVVEVCARLGVSCAVPDITVMFVHVVNEDIRIRVQYIE